MPFRNPSRIEIKNEDDYNDYIKSKNNIKMYKFASPECNKFKRIEKNYSNLKNFQYNTPTNNNNRNNYDESMGIIFSNLNE